jgi:hypothetical protein
MVPLVQALLLAGVAYILTGRVTNAIERGKLDLSNVTEMRELILALHRTHARADSALATAGALATFGHYAIIPFIDLLENGETNQVVAAQSGLRSVALLEPQAVSRQMRRVVRNRSRLYSWKTHRFAIRLLGEMEDGTSAPDLRAYASVIQSDSVGVALRNLQSIVRSTLPPDEAQLGQVQEELDLALRAVRRR